MHKRNSYLAVLSALVGLLLNAIVFTNAVVAKDAWIVQKDAAECILENLEGYRALNRKIVIISVEDCPNTDLFSAALSGKQNAGGLTTDIKTKPKSDQFDRFLAYPRDVFQCLDASKVKFENERVLFPKVVNCVQ